MTPKRRDYLVQRCRDSAVYLKSATDQGKQIPRFDTIVEMFQILEEIISDSISRPKQILRLFRHNRGGIGDLSNV